jgi:hypothetical protein
MTYTAKPGYAPRPGTASYRILQHLQASGTCLTRTQLCADLGIKPAEMYHITRRSITSGLLVVLRSPTDGTEYLGLPGMRAPHTPDTDDTTGIVNQAGMQCDGVQWDGTPRINKWLAHAQGESAAPPKPLSITRWPDDDISISGFHITDDGTTIMLNRDMVRQLVDYLCQPHTYADRLPF